MGVIVEMLGAPGAGKTSLVSAVERAGRTNGLVVYTVEGAAREFARRTALGRLAGRVATGRQQARVLWAAYRVVSGWHTICFALSRRDLTGLVLRSQRERPVDADTAHRRVLYWFFRTAGSHRFVTRHCRHDEVVVLDEGFVHRTVQLHTSVVETPDPTAVRTYLASLPAPDLVIHVDASVDTCQRRVRDRGAWERLSHRAPAEIDHFVAHAHSAVGLARQEIDRRNWRVIDVDNDSSVGLDDALTSLTRELTDALAGDERPVEKGVRR